MSLEAWHFYGSTNTDPGAFLAENDDYAYLVVPQQEALAVAALGPKQALSLRKSEIKVCFNSSQAGARLFSCAMRSLVEEEVSAVIKERLKEFEATKQINMSAVAEWQRITSQKLEAIGGIHTLAGRRMVPFIYRGLTIRLLVKSPETQAELACWCLLRGQACAQGILSSLPAEEDVVTEGVTVLMSMSKDLFKKAERARGFLGDCLRELPEDDQSAHGDAIEAMHMDLDSTPNTNWNNKN